MKWQIAKIISALVVILSLVAMPLAEVQAKIEEVVEKSFEVSSGGMLLVDSERGSIDIGTHDKNTVDIEVVFKVKTGREEYARELIDDFALEFENTSKSVEIYGDFHGEQGWFGTRNNKLQVEFHILVPREFNLDLKTSGGSIHVDDLKGEVDARTSGGSLGFNNIEGPVTGRTSGGSISLKSCTGEANIKTSGGSISIGRVDGDVDAHTSGGSIHVDEVRGVIDASTSGGSVTAYITEQPKSDCRLTTSGGSVNVFLDPKINVDIDAKTSAGSVHSDFDVAGRDRKNRSSLRGEINDGGPELYLRTSGGGIYINEI
ncbi:MAG: DUF4097 family beta strand repeat protein [candidate division Zixibacteria bacterium]|nr:DUF4097 family beta strand repeat protein [candidate division Zixibacteria bacterium]